MTAKDADEDEPRSAIHVGDNARVEELTVHGDVAGRDIIRIAEERTWDVSDLSSNPYRGLASFTYTTRAFYGGREQQVGEAVDLLTAPGDEPVLVFVTGASGSGKSSFVQAGVVPALEESYARSSRHLVHAVMRPGRGPLSALSRALAELGYTDPDWPARLARPRGLIDVLETQTPPNRVNVLVVDQFEELFTQSTPADRNGLCALLADLPPFAKLRTHLLVTLRSDYLAAIFDLPDLFEPFKRHGIELRAMLPDELARAIRQPLLEQARREGKSKALQPALVERLIDDVGGDPTLLPLLQVTLTSLWDEPPHRMTLDRYADLTDALEHLADRAYQIDRAGRPRTDADRAMAITLFLDLVEVSLDDDPRRDVRRTLRKVDLVREDPTRSRLIDELVEARLLATRVEQRGDTTVELVDIIHETLLQNWPRLRDAIAAAREQLQAREHFRLAVSEWIEHESSDAFVLQGGHLSEARDLAARGDIALRDPNARAFLDRSAALEEEERQRELVQARALAEEQRARAEDSARSALRLRMWLVATVAALLVALIAGGTAIAAYVQAERQARLNASRELGAFAQAQLGTNPELAILLAREGLRITDTDQAQAALRSALARSAVRHVWRAPNSTLTQAAYSPDGGQVVTAADDGVGRVFDARSGQLASELRGHRGPVSVVNFGSDGQRVLTGGADGTARVWDWRSGAQLAELGGHSGRLRAAVFSPDGSRVATTAEDGTIAVWDARSGTPRGTLDGHSAAASRLRFSADGERLVSASLDQTARVWDVNDMRLVAELRGHQGPLLDAAFDSSGQRVVTASFDATARVWDAASGSASTVFRGHERPVLSARFSPDGGSVLTASQDETARIWSAATGAESAKLAGHLGQVSAAEFSPDGNTVLTVGSDGTARLWAAANGGRQVAELRGHTRELRSGEFSPTGEQVVTTGLDGTVRAWQVDSGQEWLGLAAHTGSVFSAAFSPDAARLASGGSDTMLRLWMMLGRPWSTARSLGATVTNVSYSPDGRWLAIGQTSGRGLILDLQRETPPLELPGHMGFLFTTTFTPDSRRVVTAGQDGVARVWDPSSASLLGELRGHTDAVTSAVVSPSGRRMATASADGSARIWDADSLQTVRELRGHAGGLHRVAFTPDERRVLTAGADGTVRVWEVESGREERVLRGHSGAVYSVAASADGRLLLTAGADATVLVWDTTTWERMAELLGATNEVSLAAFSPDDQRVVTASNDGIVRVYPREMFAPLDEILALAPARVMRQPPELSPEERGRYLHE